MVGASTRARWSRTGASGAPSSTRPASWRGSSTCTSAEWTGACRARRRSTTSRWARSAGRRRRSGRRPGRRRGAYHLAPGASPREHGRRRRRPSTTTASTGRRPQASGRAYGKHLAGAMGPARYPDRIEADRKLLCYTSEPLVAGLEVTGHPVVTLSLACDRDDAVALRLPRGRRARRSGARRDRCLPPARPPPGGERSPVRARRDLAHRLRARTSNRSYPAR